MFRRTLKAGVATATLSAALAGGDALAQEPASTSDATPAPASPSSEPQLTATPEPTPEPTATPEPTIQPDQGETIAPEQTPEPQDGGDEVVGSFEVELSDKPRTRHSSPRRSGDDRAGRRGGRPSRGARGKRRKDKAAASQPGAPEPGPGARRFGSLAKTMIVPRAAHVSSSAIDAFRIPPFLLPIYQAAGMQYGIRWEVLAAINEVETDFGRNLNVSSAGAVGWMQFMPATWEAYGVDANRDGLKDPYNPVDAIFAAARYLKAAGANEDLLTALYAYNHADWYVDDVLVRAAKIGTLPVNFVSSLAGLSMARFPVHAKARYTGAGLDGTGIRILTRKGAPVVAVGDGRIVNVGHSARLGRFVQLQDAYGNVFTYAHLGKVARTVPAVRRRDDDAAARARRRATRRERIAPPGESLPASALARSSSTRKDRLFANPRRPRARRAGGELQIAEASYRPVKGAPLPLSRRNYRAKRLHEGARVLAGTVLGRVGRTPGATPYLLFEIRPAGSGAPRIDPRPIVEGWKLLETSRLERARPGSIGRALLMDKTQLQKAVLADRRISIYECGRRDIRLGAIDRRVLATLAYLSASGLRPTVTSLQCGHGYYTASGNVSEHSSGNAVDIAAINDITISPETQGPGTITETTIQRLLTLQGTMEPHQIISLMKFEGAPNTYAMGDHHDHIHVGFQPMYGTNSKAARRVGALLRPDQWPKVAERLRDIENPAVPTKASRYAVKVTLKRSK